MAEPESKPEATDVALCVAQKLTSAGQDYAIGGAIALAYWAEPRGTVDVDFTLFMAPDKPGECVRLLQKIGCDFATAEALQSLNQHGFCRVAYEGLRVDVFLPIVSFYEDARQRRRRVMLEGQEIMVWDAETLAVFKMMFFRRKDVADVERIIRVQRESLDHRWIRDRLIEIYGSRDPRIAQWDELITETSINS